MSWFFRERVAGRSLARGRHVRLFLPAFQPLGKNVHGTGNRSGVVVNDLSGFRFSRRCPQELTTTKGKLQSANEEAETAQA
jgi:hypothetical protein